MFSSRVSRSLNRFCLDPLYHLLMLTRKALTDNVPCNDLLVNGNKSETQSPFPSQQIYFSVNDRTTFAETWQYSNILSSILGEGTENECIYRRDTFLSSTFLHQSPIFKQYSQASLLTLELELESFPKNPNFISIHTILLHAPPEEELMNMNMKFAITVFTLQSQHSSTVQKTKSTWPGH